MTWVVSVRSDTGDVTVECLENMAAYLDPAAAPDRPIARLDPGPSPDPYVAGTLLAIRRVADGVGLCKGLDRLLFG